MGVSTQFAQQSVITAVIAPPLVGCVHWSQHSHINGFVHRSSPFVLLLVQLNIYGMCVSVVHRGLTGVWVYIDVCYCGVFSVLNVYLDHLKFCVVCINSRRYVCCSECDVVSNECNEPTSCLVQPIGAH